jgi:hypothetical protein
MSGGVGQRLLDDAEERGLQRDRQTSSTLGQGELDGQALLPLAALRILLQRRDQAKLVEDGRAQVVDEAADVLDVSLREVSQFLELLRRSGIGLDQLAGGAEAEVEGGEGGADAIVQLAGAMRWRSSSWVRRPARCPPGRRRGRILNPFGHSEPGYHR